MSPVRVAALSDTGHSRQRNEDSVHVDPAVGLVAVADGMGGHPSGDRASALAVEEVVARLHPSSTASAGSMDGSAEERAPPSPESQSDDPPRDTDMAEAVRAANRRILRDGRENPRNRGMGTTLTVLQADGETRRFRIGHVGDSRAYRLREGTLQPLTRDHTPVQARVDAGELTREEARRHPMSHMLSQALGTTSEVEPQVVDGDVLPGDLFLLCTDGLTAVLSEAEIEEALREGPAAELEKIAERLVERTLQGGAPDNVTVALLRLAGDVGGSGGS